MIGDGVPLGLGQALLQTTNDLTGARERESDAVAQEVAAGLIIRDENIS